MLMKVGVIFFGQLLRAPTQLDSFLGFAQRLDGVLVAQLQCGIEVCLGG